MRCLVLGGGGFIGSHIVDRLLDAGHSVGIFERPRVPRHRAYSPTEPVEWIEGDFQNTALVREVVDGHEVVVHLVSTTLPKASNEDPAFDVLSNVIGTLRLLEAAVAARVRKVIFISSGGTVYGTTPNRPVAEDHPTEPRVSYAIGKLAIEKYLAVFRAQHGLDYVVLRVANPYGERQRADVAQGAVAAFVRHAALGTPIEIWGDGTVTRDYVYVDDVAQAFLRAIDYEGEPRLFNIGSGRGCTLNELVDLIEARAGRKVERRYLPGRSIDVPYNVLDIGLARRWLCWEPRITLEQGIARTYAWAARELGATR